MGDFVLQKILELLLNRLQNTTDFGLIKWNVALDMLNTFAITFYQPFIMVGGRGHWI
jgi:hypothetical protein